MLLSLLKPAQIYFSQFNAESLVSHLNATQFRNLMHRTSQSNAKTLLQFNVKSQSPFFRNFIPRT